MKGDRHGALTFNALGRNAHSTVDYIITQPHLVFNEGSTRPGVYMNVVPHSRCPQRIVRNGRKDIVQCFLRRFDHCPVAVEIPIAYIPPPPSLDVPKPVQSPDPTPKLRWIHDRKDEYVEIIQSDGAALKNLYMITSESDVDATMASALLADTIWHAASIMQARKPNTISTDDDGVKRKHQPWVSDVYLDLRRQLKILEASSPMRVRDIQALLLLLLYYSNILLEAVN